MKTLTSNNKKPLKEAVCTDCGQYRIVQRHHSDYAKPDETVDLCVPCHRKWHKGNRKGENHHLRGVLSITTNKTEERILHKLTELQGTGRATVVKLLLREYGPVKIADLKKKLSIHADTNPSSDKDKDTKVDIESQEKN